MTSSISSYNFENSDRFFGYNHRIKITMSSGKVYNIAAEVDLNKSYLPKCMRKIFWAQVQLSDENGNNKTFLINRNSLAKRTGTSDSLTKFALKRGKKDKSFDTAMRILHKADKIAQVMEANYYFRSTKLKKAGELVKIIEKNKAAYTERAAEDGGFVEKKKGHTFVVRIDPKDPSRTNFYIKQAKLIGQGGYKTVHPLIDYETEKPKYALSIQRGNNSHFSRMAYPLNGFEIMTKLHGSKNIMKGELLYEEGVTRSVEGNVLSVDKNAASYLVTKLYQGTFSKIVKAKNIKLKIKLMLFLQILQGVSDMHAKGIVHCDLKNANVLYKFKDDIFKIKIIDFDLSKTFEERIESKHSPGTLNYKAPEIFAKKGITHPDKLDSWSLGIMLFQICEGAPAFFKTLNNVSKEELEASVINGVKNLQFKNLSQNDPLRETILGLLKVDPSLRLSVDAAKEAIEKHLPSLS